MGWFTTFKGKRLEPVWEFAASGIIWRLLPSPAGYFVGEERDVNNKSVSFFCLEQESGTVRWRGRGVGQQWWVSLDSIHERTVFLHEYATPDMPDQKKIYALDLDTGDVRWTSDELRFLFAYEASIYASKDGFEGRQFFELDLAKGKVIREIDASYLNVLRENIGPRREHVDFPRVLDQPTGQGNELWKAVEKIVPGEKQLGLVEYLERNDSVALSIYENTSDVPTQQSFRQHLGIVGKEKGDERFKDILVEHATTPVPDTFFAVKDFIYYIKEKNRLRAIDLSATKHS
ncbi:MAG: DUF4905 domain-containing protein [Ignavibacteriae bacterium]|nr:DUF4905 domain-containing protein [Ignavibacteria bacterium]MBI3364066.1 DUF4905 domain-containing protein [Ignavibacteriota bacterium]